jgi:hypothetical protein
VCNVTTVVNMDIMPGIALDIGRIEIRMAEVGRTYSLNQGHPRGMRWWFGTPIRETGIRWKN